MKQQTLAAAADQNSGFERYRRSTKRDVFLATMNEIVPWRELCEVIEPHYPKPGNGRPPIGLERMLRMYFVQHWFNLADEACEDALLDSTALRRFVSILQASGPQHLADGGKQLLAKLVLLKQPAKLQQRGGVGNTLSTQVVGCAPALGTSRRLAPPGRAPCRHRYREVPSGAVDRHLRPVDEEHPGLVHLAPAPRQRRAQLVGRSGRRRGFRRGSVSWRKPPDRGSTVSVQSAQHLRTMGPAAPGAF